VAFLTFSSTKKKGGIRNVSIVDGRRMIYILISTVPPSHCLPLTHRARSSETIPVQYTPESTALRTDIKKQQPLLLRKPIQVKGVSFLINQRRRKCPIPKPVYKAQVAMRIVSKMNEN
jgi:hypothetical protein